MGLVIEPSLSCDSCGQQIRPGDRMVNVYNAEFTRVETPPYEAAYADYRDVTEDQYFHAECVAPMLTPRVWDGGDAAEPDIDEDLAAYLPETCATGCCVPEACCGEGDFCEPGCCGTDEKAPEPGLYAGVDLALDPDYTVYYAQLDPDTLITGSLEEMLGWLGRS